jgi:hypothetical protein
MQTLSCIHKSHIGFVQKFALWQLYTDIPPPGGGRNRKVCRIPILTTLVFLFLSNLSYNNPRISVTSVNKGVTSWDGLRWLLRLHFTDAQYSAILLQPSTSLGQCLTKKASSRLLLTSISFDAARALRPLKST